MGDSSGHSLEACIRAWRGRRPYPGAKEGEALADYHFSHGDFDAAVAGYATCEPSTEQIRAKRGWCLAMLDRCEEAQNFLTPENCGTSCAELAVLAATIAGGWNRSKLYGEAMQARRRQVDELVHRALQATDRPDPLAFFAYMDLVEWYEDREAALAVAERAVSLYPSAALIEWHARLLRTLGRLNDAAFDVLLRHVPDEPHANYVHEMLQSALALSRYDDACGALDRLEQQLRPEEDPTFDSGVALLRAYVDLRRAQDADPGAAARGLAVASRVHHALSGRGPAQDLLLFAAKLRLALAIVSGDVVSIRDSAMSIIEAAWSAQDAPDYSPRYELMSVGGVLCEPDFGVGFRAPEVLTSLSSKAQLQWQLLNALHSINDDEEPAPHTREFIARHGADWAPAWAAHQVAEVILSSKAPRPRDAGRALARFCLHGERRGGAYAITPNLDYDDLSVEQLEELVDGIGEELRGLDADAAESGRLLLTELGLILTRRQAYQPLMVLSDGVLARAPDEQDALFYAALARQELMQGSAARPLYERLLKLNPNNRSAYWNLTSILEAQGDVDAIEDMLPELEQHAARKDRTWAVALKRARDALKQARQHRGTSDLRAIVTRELAHYPPLRGTHVSATELSLLEAACLVALLRACELNHSTWTLKPFAASSVPLEPTHRFRVVLLDLAMKGIIRIADSTTLEAFAAVDGQLSFFLDQVHWSISPRTLALLREIRDLSRHEWPEHWRDHAEVLSRDLAAEECVAYMEHLAEERKLDPPEPADARALFRELLEHCSVGRCWYYIYSGVQSANDYRTKYPVSRAQVTAMLLRRTRERGENAIAKGWDTSYRRIGAVPRSHLSAALHDVLTGWGERAFEEPIRMLAHPDRIREGSDA